MTRVEPSGSVRDTPPGPDDAGSNLDDPRVVLEIGPGIEWFCEPELVGWRTTAGGFDGPLDHQVFPYD